MSVLWSNCFLCTTAIDEEEDSRGGGGGGWEHHNNYCDFTPCHKLLLKYLLNDKQLEKPVSKRVVQFFETSKKLPDHPSQSGEDADGESQSATPSQFRLCSECDETARVVLDLQLQLEEIQMTIANYVTTLRNSVVNNSNLYGWNKAVGNKFRKFEKELDKKEATGGSCELERQFLEVLHQFQTEVVENDGDVVKIPLVYLEKYKSAPAKLELGSKTLVDSAPESTAIAITKRELNNEDEDYNPNYDSDGGGSWFGGGDATDNDNDSIISNSPESEDSDDSEYFTTTTPNKRKKTGKRGRPKKPVRKRRRRGGDSTTPLYPTKGICDVCNEKVYSKEMIVHLQTHDPPTMFSCVREGCDRVFGKFESLVNHVKALSHKGLEMKCGVCSDEEETSTLYSATDKLPQHLYEAHGWEQMLLKCSQPACTRTFFDRQKKRGHEVECRAKEWTCKPCKKVFPSKYTLDKHKAEDHDGKKYVCNACPDGKEFASSRMLRTHQQHTHKMFVRKRPQCETCGKTFSRHNYLRKHLSEGHGDMPVTTSYRRYKFLYERNSAGEYYCHECKEEFKSVHFLSQHYVVAHSYQQYTCEFCSWTFKMITSLQSHEKKAHGVGVPESAIFHCSQCHKQFFRETTLREHEASAHGIGEPPKTDIYTCELCGHTTKTLSGLKLHHQTNHPEVEGGGRPHHCSYCEKTFTQKICLQNHERTHTGEKPFGCDQCGKTYRTKDQLTNHIKKCHPNNEVKIDVGMILSLSAE